MLKRDKSGKFLPREDHPYQDMPSQIATMRSKKRIIYADGNGPQRELNITNIEERKSPIAIRIMDKAIGVVLTAILVLALAPAMSAIIGACIIVLGYSAYYSYVLIDALLPKLGG